MNNLIDPHEKIIQEHAMLIHLVIGTVQDSQYAQMLDNVIRQAEENGWISLIEAIRKILAGVRNLSELGALDEEDRHIVIAILRGIEGHEALPDVAGAIDPLKSAAHIVSLVIAARHGNTQAQQSLANMAALMKTMGGDMAQVGVVLARLINGERQLDKLVYNMGPLGTQIIQACLEELRKHEVN